MPAPARTPRQVRADPGRCGGGGRIRTYEGVSRQIYSLLPLAAWVPLRENELRILISGTWGVNASWRGICWRWVRSGSFFQKWPSQRPRRGLLGRCRGSDLGAAQIFIELPDFAG